MESNTGSDAVSNLQYELCKLFPHFGRLEFYFQISCDSKTHFDHKVWQQDEWIAEHNMNSKNVCEMCKYRCRLIFLGMPLQSLEYFKSFQDAKANVSLTAKSILIELDRLIISKTLDDACDELLSPIIAELKKSQIPVISDNPDQNHHLNPIPVVSNLQKPLVQSEINSLIDMISQKMYSVDSNLEEKERSSSSKCEITRISESQDRVNPISILHQHYQKRSDLNLTPPRFDYFERKGCYGCILEYHGKKFVVEAIYRNKNDARCEASRLACMDLFGKQFSFTKSQSYDETTSENNKEAIISESSVLLDSKLEGIQIAAAKTPSSFSLNGAKPCTTCLNEFCQINKLPLPDFQFKTGPTVSSFYICYLQNFPLNETLMHKNDIQFTSAAFIKKNEAKEDCAKRAIQKLVEDGKVTSDGKPVKLSMESQGQKPIKSTKYDANFSKFIISENFAGLTPTLPSPLFYPSHPFLHQQLVNLQPDGTRKVLENKSSERNEKDFISSHSRSNQDNERPIDPRKRPFPEKASSSDKGPTAAADRPSSWY